ncbi:hypothetical protein [Streptacidiphilus neutrinimicus]|uniref:hypothetical protein n=1 Tax=Streptacidiphilus neutrinimicus TaxID=105420 RepID=UPI00126A23D4|nr:hypothetical protein [Streptacidiphilus neutrinimicus]
MAGPPEAAAPDPAVRPWTAHAAPQATHTGQGPQPQWLQQEPPSSGQDHASGFADAAAAGTAWSPGERQPQPPAAGGAAEAPWSLRQVMDLAAAAELGARPPAASGPAQSPIGPVTPGQAARLQSVHLEPTTPQPPADGAGNPFNPPSLVAMPPLADHAPRPPAPEEIRPADGEHAGGDPDGNGHGNGAAGEVARVR